jgi:hypothetical protein
MIGLTIRSPIGAAGVIANILTGTDLEYVTGGGVLTIWGNGDIAGMTHSLRFTLMGTPQNPIPTSTLNAASTVGNVKADEDLIVARLPIPPGSRLVHVVSNPGAASNVTLRYQLE